MSKHPATKERTTMKDKIIAKLQKLLALQSSPNEAEAAAAAAKAAELMRVHSISISELKTDEDEDNKGIISTEQFESTKHVLWKMIIAQYCAKLNGVGMYTEKGRYSVSCKSYVCHRFYGRKAGVETTKLMAQYLIDTVSRLSKQECKGMGLKYAEAFRLGCAERLAIRLNEKRKQMEAEGAQSEIGSCTALAVRSQYEKDEHLAKKTLIKNNIAPTEKEIKTQSGRDQAGRAAGRAAGDRISLDPQLEQSASESNRLAS